jgi:ABC-2 type transport system ATP-binding protein
MAECAIRTENLTRDFSGLRAVDRISFEVPAGTVFGFLGPNGAGKTTTIRLLLGLLEPTVGRAEVLGYDAHRDADRIREQTGSLLEHDGLYDRLSAEANLKYYAGIYRMRGAERQARLKEVLSFFDLWDRRREPVRTWSRGMRQKLAIARALLHRPSLIFLDEPTAGLDPISAAHLREQLAALAAREGATVFLTTHNLAEAEKLCHSVGIIHKGRLLAVGPLERLRAIGGRRLEIAGRGFSEAIVRAVQSRPEVVRTSLNGSLTVELRGNVSTAPLITDLVMAGVEIEEVCKNSASLEEIFLSLVEEEA